jgi:hypothetical protein
MPLDRKSLAEALTLMESGEWNKAHEIVQVDEDSIFACWAHGITHLMEGDIANARYWYREAKLTFPANPSVTTEINRLKAALTSG